MKKKIAETQKLDNGMFNKLVVMFVYRKINSVYREIELKDVLETMGS